jgi:hypothetical protein
MIRILTLLVSLFTFGLVDLADITYEIPVQDMLYFRDTPIAELNGLTLNDVFETGNLVTNGDFSDGTTGWTTGVVGSFNVNNGVARLTGGGSTTNNMRLSKNIPLDTNTYYLNIGLWQSSYNVLAYVIQQFDGTNLQSIYGSALKPTSLIYTSSLTSSTMRYDFIISKTSNITLTEFFEIDNIYLLNITALGLTSLTKTQIDRYYELWQNPQLNITYTINELDTQDLIILLASQSVWTIIIYILQKYAYRSYKKSKRMGM